MTSLLPKIKVTRNVTLLSNEVNEEEHDKKVGFKWKGEETAV
jgi:hypothetical protein